MGAALSGLCRDDTRDKEERVGSDAGDGVADEESPVIQEVARPKLDPADFWLKGLEGQTVVREPGQVQGQQFIVEECKDCDIFLLDHSAQVTVDLAENCRIFIGPCESSVFLRDCKGCSVVVACQQLRLRDCAGMDMLVHVTAGQPSIETSTGVRLGCFGYSYFSLREQFRAAGLSVWNTRWSNVHDFNHAAGEEHWSYLPAGHGAADLGLRPVAEVSSTVSADEAALPSAVPSTWGSRPRPAGAGDAPCLALAFSPDLDAGFRLLDALSADLAPGGALRLVRTREAPLKAAQIKALAPGAPDAKAAAAAGPTVGLEFEGTPEAVARAAAAARDAGLVAFDEPDEARAASTRLFDEYAHTV